MEIDVLSDFPNMSLKIGSEITGLLSAASDSNSREITIVVNISQKNCAGIMITFTAKSLF